jgi:flagellar protein FliO/FliZ
MDSYFFWTSLLVVLAVLSVGITIFVRSYLTGMSPAALLFRPKVDRRLEVIDHASIDGRRKLILIRRDDVEHLLLTGGPVDVVVETGIKSAAARPALVSASGELQQPSVRRAPLFSRANEPEPMIGTPEL